MTSPAFLPRTIGVTENTLRALLVSHLKDTGLDYHTWVLFNAVALDAEETDRDRLTATAIGGLKIDKPAVDAAIERLADAGLVTIPPGLIRLTEQGADLHRRLAGPMGEATVSLVRDLPVDDVAAANRVLTTIAERANALLAASR